MSKLSLLHQYCINFTSVLKNLSLRFTL